MSKDPAFLFYPNDWLGGTLGMTFEEKGAYMELLMLQFNRGHMTSHMMGHTVGQHLDKLLDKFVQDGNGLYYNVRLEEEKKKRETFTASRRNNIKGSNQFTKKDSKKEGHKKGHMTSHMENENKDNIDTIKEDEIYLQSKKNWEEIVKPSKWFDAMIKNNFTTKEFLLKSLESFWVTANYLENPEKKEVNDIKLHFANWLKTNPPKKIAAQVSDNPAPWVNFGKQDEI